MNNFMFRNLVLANNSIAPLFAALMIATTVGLRQIKNKFGLSKSDLELIHIPLMLTLLFVIYISSKYTSKQIAKYIKDPKYASEDQDLALLIAEGKEMEFFCRVMPKKLFIIANNLSDTNSSVDYHRFPWHFLNGSIIMHRIKELFRLKDENSHMIFNAMVNSKIKILPKEIIFLIMEYMNVAPLIISNATKDTMKHNLMTLYDELQACSMRMGQIYPFEWLRDDELWVDRINGYRDALSTQKGLMLQQYDSFIDDMSLEAKREFIGQIESEDSLGERHVGFSMNH